VAKPLRGWLCAGARRLWKGKYKLKKKIREIPLFLFKGREETPPPHFSFYFGKFVGSFPVSLKRMCFEKLNKSLASFKTQECLFQGPGAISL